MKEGKKYLPEDIHVYSREHLDSSGYFYVGGKFVSSGEGGTLMKGQMYTEVYVPKEVKQEIPLVLIHGAWQTGTCWMGTPDGREGWLEYFLKRGYIVYIIDQPCRGRSAAHSEMDGEKRTASLEAVQRTFAGNSGAFAHSQRHTQWPGAVDGSVDETLWNFYATQVESLTSQSECQQLFREAGTALLEKIGKAVLIGHSQGGPYTWILADACPDKVEAVVAIEPTGPPFTYGNPNVPNLDEEGHPKSWGVSEIPLTYEPPVQAAAELEMKFVESPDSEHIGGYLQKEPARALVNLKKIPHLLVSSESSYHASYDYLTAKYLKQAGVAVKYVSLPEEGICGNGHCMQIEKNNIEIADFIADWIERTVK